MKDKFLHPAEIIEILNLSKRAIMSLIRRNELKAYRFGSQIRIREDHFNEFLEKSKINGRE